MNNEIKGGVKFPTTAIIIIDSRSDKNPEWVNQAMESIDNQYYKPDEVIRINNLGRYKTIGRCWNEAVQKTSADFVLFMGDDDFLAEEYLLSLLLSLKRAEHEVGEVTCMSSYAIAFSEQHSGPMNKVPTGLWKRQFILDNPFDEELPRLVDTTYIRKHINTDNKMVIVPHNFGYYYRQHDGMTSGRVKFING